MALRIARENPDEAVRLNIGRVDIDEQDRLRDGGLIDLNNSSVPALGSILGLDAAQAQTLEQTRAAVGAFTSAADFEVQMSWDPHIFDPVAGRLISLPRLGSARFDRRQTLGANIIARADGRTAGTPIDPSPLGTHAASYVWAISPLLTGGLAAAPAIAFAAARLKSARLWWISGFYLAALLSLAFTEGLTQAADWNTIAQWVLGGIATVHALLLRKDVFEVDVVRSDRLKRQEALRIVAGDPQEAIRLQIGRVDRPEADRFPDGGLIDMNNVPGTAMCVATGIETEIAQRIVETRTILWGFSSLADLCNQLDQIPQMFDPVSGRLIFLPMRASSHAPQTMDLPRSD